MSGDVVLVPVQLQAFVLNPAVCNTGKDDDNGARIVPITQPNYTFLRLDNFVLQSDVVNHIDMHNSAPADRNSRMTDLGARPNPAPRRNRHGVYVHWILPQVYRTGVTSGDSVPEKRREEERLRRGLPPRDKNLESADSSNTPEFLQPPTRYIVVRKLDLDSVSPAAAKPNFKEYQAWVIESDYRWQLDSIPADYDLEVDVSPFVVGVADGQDADIVQQAEVFIGRKTPLENWSPKPDDQYIDNLTLLRSNNQLFADFQLHNSNVFSILDNFEYGGPDAPRLYLDKANASYYLFGWHKDDITDPLYDKSGKFTHDQKLEALFMALVDSGIPDVTKAWLESSDPARLCLHGAIYDVKWDHSSKPKSVPADDYAARIKNQEVPAISIGTTPIDAMLNYITARKGHEEGLIAKLEEDILLIDTLLHARDDGVEGQREAKDAVYNWNYSRSKGGTHFFLGGEDATGRPTQPNAESIRALEEINQLQQLLDGCDRLARQRRWEMFSLWWKYVSDVSNKDRPSQNPAYRSKAADLSTRVAQLQKFTADLRAQVQKKTGEGTLLANAKTGTKPHFYRARDPTMLIGGVEPGWPSDFSSNVSVRLPVQTVVPDAVPAALSQLAADIQKAFPGIAPLKYVARLLGEFYALLPGQKPAKDPPKGHAYPQFHDSPGGDVTLRDQWGDRQPWFPLFVEWEVEYTHVPFDWWALDEQASRLSDNKLVRYGIEVPGGKPLWEEIAKRPHSPNTKEPPDTRILSGRVLILPQPSFSLATKVRQLFSDTPTKILDEYLDADERQNLLDNLSALQYISSPLSGLTEGLLTLNMGTHVKPEYKDVTNDGETLTAIRAAQFDAAGLTKTNIELIAGNSGLTPFAASTSFATDRYCPFKPVTHGQMRFRKLNVIDKFGQAIVAIDPQPRRDQCHPPLFPAISDFYEPQAVLVDGHKVANTVVQNNGDACEFIQLPPQINQNARLNAEFVTAAAAADGKPKSGGGQDDDGRPYWRPTTEWESPIWGWIVTNYADYGIQLFTKEGIFYGEVRIGGPNGALASPSWSPFNPPGPSATSPQDLARLDALIKRFREQPDYLKGFWTMLTKALDSLPPAPSAYAQFLSSIVGKPLALVNTGWSVELDSPPLTNQSTRAKVATPEKQLIDPDKPDDGYIFQVKLGDKEREYDGLVGYFDGFAGPKNGEELDYDHIKTYFHPTPNPFANLIPIGRDNYPKFKPYHVSPFPEDDPPDYQRRVDPAAYADRRNAELGRHVFGAVVDPFTAVHAYSSFLPAQTLALRPWTWQAALANLVAFLHAGPLTLLDGGVVGGEGYDPSAELTADNARERPRRNVVGLPLAAAGDWNWLQPYVDPTTPGSSSEGDPPVPPPVYNAYGIEKKGNPLSPGFQDGPYTAVEGFLLLRRPIMTEDPKKG
ncbi:hypothetical protein QBC46DRAFT_350202 [Diplogelasinospora grovesii]|uniref:Uncharacterized protein n=1 Tax=Diplogelasinospora grovesii TaxID=303347 RepID=A0AAN6NFG5_9PEZI|nr:hypothetical protein QBC46DRAFT_350202 [Diplogelasinospora grovesii]